MKQVFAMTAVRQEKGVRMKQSLSMMAVMRKEGVRVD